MLKIFLRKLRNLFIQVVKYIYIIFSATNGNIRELDKIFGKMYDDLKCIFYELNQTKFIDCLCMSPYLIKGSF